MLQGITYRLFCLLPVLLLPATAGVAAESPVSTEVIADTTADATADATAKAPSSDTQPNDDVQRQRLLEQKARIEARIDVLQESAEPGMELQEAWMELGDIAQALHLHTDAIQAWNNAWQEQRSTAGLEDPGQIPILKQLLASQRAAEDWKQADVTAHLIQHIAVRTWPPGAAERLDAVLQLGRWKLLAARDALLPNAFATAFQAAELYRAEINTLQATEGAAADRIQLATLLLEKASAEYLVAQQINAQPLQNYYLGNQRSSSTMLQCQAIRLPDGSTQRICMPVEVPNLDFYVDPANRKNQEIQSHLGAMREDIAAAFQYLSMETEHSAERAVLLEDMQGLTALYNDFYRNARTTP